MAIIKLEITTPEKRAFQGTVDDLTVPGSAGLLGIRPGHAPLLCAMLPGILTATIGGVPKRFVLGGGFLEVSNDHVRILADTVEQEGEIDLERAQLALQNATAALMTLAPETSEYRYQKFRQMRARSRIQVAIKAVSER